MNSTKKTLAQFYTPSTIEPTAHFLTTICDKDEPRRYERMLAIVAIPFSVIKAIIRTGLLLRHDTLGIEEMQMSLKQYPISVVTVDSPIFSDCHPLGAYDTNQAADLLQGITALLQATDTKWLPLTMVQAIRFPLAAQAKSFCSEHFFIDTYGLLLDGYQYGTTAEFMSTCSLPWGKLVRFTEDNESSIFRQRMQNVSEKYIPGHGVFQLTKEAGGPVRHLIFHQHHPTKEGHTMWWANQMKDLITLSPAALHDCYLTPKEAYMALLELQIERVTYTMTNLSHIDAGSTPRPLIEAAAVPLVQA